MSQKKNKLFSCCHISGTKGKRMGFAVRAKIILS
jgi:hypothetical protein